MVDLEKESKAKPIGPICERCGKSSDSVYPCYVKRVRRGCAEMVKIYLCAYHFFEQLESDTEEPEMCPPPPDDGEDKEAWEDFDDDNPDDNDEEEEDEEDDESEPNKCNVDHVNQSWG